MTDHRSPLDAALDLVLYAPVGLALTITEELPRLAAKGRSGVGARVTTARVVGQFAVAQGRKEITRRLGADTSGRRFATPAPGRSAPTAAAREPTDNGAVPATSSPPSPSPASPGASAASSGASAAPPVGSLAIPGYDSLSASQVVQRLAGLSGPELQAVKEYESASRGRRTILARVGQLQGQ